MAYRFMLNFKMCIRDSTLDCALLEGELASQLLAALREQDLPELAAEIAPEDGPLYRQGQHRIPLHCFPCDAESRGELYFAG